MKTDLAERYRLLAIFLALWFFSSSLLGQVSSLPDAILIVDEQSDSSAHQLTLLNTASFEHTVFVNIGQNELADISYSIGGRDSTVQKGWAFYRRGLMDIDWQYEEVVLLPQDTVTIRTVLSSFTGRPSWLDQISYKNEKPEIFILYLFEEAKWGLLICFIFLGTCIALFLYFLALSIIDTKKEHILFALFLLTVSWNTFMMVDGGMDVNIVFKRPYHYMYLNDLFINLTFISYTFFVFYFLEIRKHSVFLARFLFFQISFHVFLSLLCVSWNYGFDDLMTVREQFSLLYIISFLLSLVALFLIWRRVPSKLKYPIIIGSLLWSITSLIELSHGHGYTLRDYIIEDWDIFSFSITQIGFVPIILGFSLAIGFKNKMRDNDKIYISQQLVHELEKNEKLQKNYTDSLESEVQKKTREALEIKERALKSEFENTILQLEADQLISQMNPHFIFNSLNSIKYYAITKETSETAAYITEFAELMRTILDHSRKKKISVEEEVQFLEIYLIIEAKRFDFRFSHTVRVLGDVSSLMIPPMLIQPHVENAIIHGKINQQKNGRVDVLIERSSDAGLKILIKDNGIGRVAAKHNRKNTKRDSHATKILQQRVNVLNQSSDQLIIIEYQDLYTQDKAAGTKVTIDISSKG